MNSLTVPRHRPNAAAGGDSTSHPPLTDDGDATLRLPKTAAIARQRAMSTHPDTIARLSAAAAKPTKRVEGRNFHHGQLRGKTDTEWTNCRKRTRPSANPSVTKRAGHLSRTAAARHVRLDRNPHSDKSHRTTQPVSNSSSTRVQIKLTKAARMTLYSTARFPGFNTQRSKKNGSPAIVSYRDPLPSVSLTDLTKGHSGPFSPETLQTEPQSLPHLDDLADTAWRNTVAINKLESPVNISLNKRQVVATSPFDDGRAIALAS